MGLRLHAGAQHITRADLALLPTPEPLGRHHVIRPVIADVEIIADCLDREGFMISDESFGVSYDEKHDPAKFFGVLELRPKSLQGDVITAKEYALDIGIRGSYDQSLGRGMAIGSRVFVCDNLAFSGDITINTKQTTNIGDRIYGMLRDAVSQVAPLAALQDKRFELYHDFEMKPRTGDAALVEMVRLGVLNPSQVGKAIQEWDTPSHEEHAVDGFTVWRLQQAVTEAIKPSNPERPHVMAAWDRTTKMTQFLDKLVQLQ